MVPWKTVSFHPHLPTPTPSPLMAHTEEVKRDPAYYYYGKKADAEDAVPEKRAYYYYGKAADAETEEKREVDAESPVE
jgi:hypothetical protein